MQRKRWWIPCELKAFSFFSGYGSLLFWNSEWVARLSAAVWGGDHFEATFFLPVSLVGRFRLQKSSIWDFCQAFIVVFATSLAAGSGYWTIGLVPLIKMRDLCSSGKTWRTCLFLTRAMLNVTAKPTWVTTFAGTRNFEKALLLLLPKCRSTTATSGRQFVYHLLLLLCQFWTLKFLPTYPSPYRHFGPWSIENKKHNCWQFDPVQFSEGYLCKFCWRFC